MTKLSVAIATYNEEENIDRCLESVQFADEIILVDEGSTDKTVVYAKKFTKNITFAPHHFVPRFHESKQKAIDKCTSDWILEIDADEEVTPDLKKEIIHAVSEENEFFAFQIPRKNRIFGYWMKHTGWYPDYQIKLFKKNHGHYPCRSVHELIEVDGPIGTLKFDLLHYHYKSIDQFLNRLIRYTTNDTNYLLEKGEKEIKWYDAIRFPTDEFLKRFFFWEGYKDGLHGLIMSLLQAFSRLVVFTKIWERQKFWNYGDEKFLSEVLTESRKTTKDLNYYLIKLAKNPFEKIIYHLKNKVNNL